MNFETIDWEVELKRIILAFGVVGSLPGSDEENRFEEAETAFGAELLLEDGLYVSVNYSEASLFFAVSTLADCGLTSVSLHLDWNGLPCDADALSQSVDTVYLAKRLARGLFHLGLLSPDTERALNLAIAVEEKIDWTLEYEARYGL